MMNQGDIFKKIGQILNELQDQYEFLARNPEQLSELELELFLANANFLSDHVQIVRKLNNNASVKELPQQTEPIIQETAEPEEIKHESSTFEFILNDTVPVEEPEQEEISDKQRFLESQSLANTEDQSSQEAEKERQAEDADDNQPSPVVPEVEGASVEPEQEPDLFKEEAIIAVKRMPEPQPVPEITPVPKAPEQPVTYINNRTEPAPKETSNNLRPTLNELLAGKRNSPVSAETDSGKPPITDLKKAITLNEKLLYIKDLFNGYNLAYSEAIDIINKMPDFKTADAFLKNNYAVKNNWQSRQNTVDKFYDLLNQRFPQA